MSTGIVAQSQNVSQASQNSAEAPKMTPASGTLQVYYISKYLVQYIAAPVQKTGKRVTGARVLTSDECYKMLEEKEELKSKKKRTKKTS